MGTREMTTRYRLAQWAEVIQERAASGETIENFCLRKGITKNAYLYWLRKLRRTACEQLSEIPEKPTALAVQGFTEVRLTGASMSSAPIESSQICIETVSCRITAGSAYPAEALAVVLREVAKS